MVDTNVAITANAKNHMSPECALACQIALNQLMKTDRLVIDAEWGIIGEYMNKLDQKGQPGLGDAFLKWVLTNQANPGKVEKIPVTPEQDTEGNDSFKEFPDHSALSKFDPSDRIFVAVAATHHENPPILQAADSKWLGLWDEALQQAGIIVEYLCKDELQQIFDNKFS